MPLCLDTELVEAQGCIKHGNVAGLIEDFGPRFHCALVEVVDAVSELSVMRHHGAVGTGAAVVYRQVAE